MYLLEVEDVEVLPPGLLVPHYLMASYLYYIAYQSPMTDEAYDYLCKRLYAEWDEVEHQHKHLVEHEALTAGTCLLNAKDYPTCVLMGADGYMRNATSGRLKIDLHTLYKNQIPVLRPREVTKVPPSRVELRTRARQRRRK